jgi:MFS transporter, ACS family, D-galactonate transporter
MTDKRAGTNSGLSRMLFLLALSVFINYLDRGNLSIAAPLLKHEFQLSATQLGVLLSWFFWTYSFFLPVSIWLLPWLRWMPEANMSSLSLARISAPSMLQILVQRSAWGTFIGLFCINYLLYFLLTWLPFYLVHERHHSLAAMAKIAGLAYFLIAVSSTLAGWVSDRCISLGRTPTVVRKTFVVVGQVGAAISLVAGVVSGPVLSIVWLLSAAVSWGISASNTWAITQTLAGPQGSGRWSGLQNLLGNLAGVVAPALTGLVVDRTGKFFWTFIITAVIASLGSLSWIFIVGALRQVDWSTSPERLAQIS